MSLLSSAIASLISKPLVSPPKPLKGIKPSNQDTPEMYQQTVQIYRELIEYIDKLLLYEAHSQNSVTETNALDSEDPETAEELDKLKNQMSLRRLIIEQALITIPTLRGIHEVAGIPEQETQIGDKITKRDELSLEIVKLVRSVDLKEIKLDELIRSNRTLRREIDVNIDSSEVKRKRKGKVFEGDEKKKDRLKKAQMKSYNLTEEIYALIITNGLNWADDEQLKEIVLYCSDIYK